MVVLVQLLLFGWDSVLTNRWLLLGRGNHFSAIGNVNNIHYFYITWLQKEGLVLGHIELIFKSDALRTVQLEALSEKHRFPSVVFHSQTYHFYLLKIKKKKHSLTLVQQPKLSLSDSADDDWDTLQFHNVSTSDLFTNKESVPLLNPWSQSMQTPFLSEMSCCL